jgi:DNA modification methylase
MGVGSTGVAALELGRRFVGIELEEGYVTAARRRLDAIVELEPVGGPIAASR